MRNLIMILVLVFTACSDKPEMPPPSNNGEDTGVDGGDIGNDTGEDCDRCDGARYIACDGPPVTCSGETPLCIDALGCVACVPGEGRFCDGDQVRTCSATGGLDGPIVEVCDALLDARCDAGVCVTACDRAAAAAGNAGCAFFAADLDRFDQNGSVSAPWGLVVTNAGDVPSELTVTRRTSAVGEALATEAIHQETLPIGGSTTITLPQAELDCSETPGEWDAPGTCLSALAFRLDATTPVVALQLNALQTSPFSEAALLLPLHALGNRYRVVTYNPGHPVRLTVGEPIVSRSTITIIGTEPNTTVTVAPTWQLRGNPPIEATSPGETLNVTLGPMEVLQLESDDAVLGDVNRLNIGDLSGSTVRADRPIAVFAGTEESNPTQAEGVSIPKYPGWDDEFCCSNHLAEQSLPDAVLGRAYAVGRSPIRSTSIFREADIVRFVGGDTASNIVTSLPAPFASFTLAPGEVRTTFTAVPFTAVGNAPFALALYTVAGGIVEGPSVGGPSMTFAPALSHFVREASFGLPSGWGRTFIVVVAPADAAPLLDGMALSGCGVVDIGTVQDTTWQQHTCEVAPGAHTLRSDEPFGLTLHGRNSTNAFSTPGALRLVAP